MILPGIKIKLRLDYSGHTKSGKLFGNKNVEQIAEENRQHQVSLIRNVPVQGVRVEDIEMSQDVYLVIDESSGKKVAYAPVVITFYADSIEDAINFSMKEEFRTVEVLEPEDLLLSKSDMEKLLYKVSKEMMLYRDNLLRKIDNWK